MTLAELALQESEERYRRLVELSPDAIGVLAFGKIKFINTAGTRLFGASHLEQLLDRPMQDLLHPDCRAILEQWVRQGSKRLKAPFTELRIIRLDGAVVTVEMAATGLTYGNTSAIQFVARDITERKEAEARIERHSLKLLGLYHMGQTVLSSLELEVVLKQVIEKLLELLGARDVSVMLLDQNELVFSAVAGANASILQSRRIPANVGIAGEVMRTGRSMRVSGETARTSVYQEIEQLTDYHTHTLLAAPLKVGGQIIGLMEAVHTEAEAFSQDDLYVLEAAASWAAIAIDNAQQHQDLRRQLHESQAMSAITQALTETLDLERNFRLIVDTAQQTIPHAQQAVIHLLDEKQQALQPVAVAGVATRSKAGFTMHPGEGIAGRVMAEGVVLRVPDISADSRYLSIGEETPFRSLLVAPVQSGGKRLGTISVASTACDVFTDHDERLLAHLGAQAAIAIEKARLYLAEREQRRFAEALRDTAAAFSHTLDREELLKTAVATIADIGHYRFVSVYLREQQGLRLAAQRGCEPNSVVPLISPNHGLPGRVIRENRAILVPDVLASPESGSTGPEIYSAMAVPLVYANELDGVLLVETTAEQRLDQDDLDWLVDVAQQLSVALENARLYTDLQNALRQEQATREQLVQADKLAAIGQMSASVAHELNNPLQAIQGCLDLAETYLSDPTKQQQYLGMAKVEVERLATIVKRMLDYYRPAKGTRERVDIGALVSDVLALGAKRLSHGKVNVKQESDPDLPRVHVVSNQIKQVFLNIILNAVEAMPNGGQLTIRTRTTEDSEGVQWLTVSFQDTGVGIRPEETTKIFEPFYTTRATGTGLGLAVSHNIITHHQGRLTVESTVGQGSTFTVWLPM